MSEPYRLYSVAVLFAAISMAASIWPRQFAAVTATGGVKA
jgi:hypothetical protein